MDDKLKRYKGELTREQLITARDKVIENAKNLFQEAQLLYDNERLSRAYFLLCICDEELGKFIIITSAIVELVDESINWKKFWCRLRSHKDKTSIIEHMENIFISTSANFIAPDDIKKIIPKLEEFKMASLYSDMFQNDFFIPNEIIPCYIVGSLIELTSKRIDFISSTVKLKDTLKNITKEDIVQFRSKFKIEALFDTVKNA